ncbi:SDR family NAD(P)-dependent oxidoreductase [Kribbella sp. NBC_00359]|uniref:SDR family NAD(P)-dependent oxidoreductase n=1 Tax=Kribbella sp. NBC_00359 TaxID=2975966 RepID=UPI002E1DB440
MNFVHAERVVAVTGAGRGLGLEITKTLLEEGAIVIANARSDASLLKELAVVHPGRLVVVTADIATDDGARAVIAAAETMGGVEVLVHNAAIARDGLLVSMSSEDFYEVMWVNVGGAFLATKYAVRRMIGRRRGRIIYVSSVVAALGNAGQANYAASKGAIEALARSVAQEYAAQNIRTAVVAPGLLDCGLADAIPAATKEVKLSRLLSGMGRAADVARLISFLATPAGNYINGEVVAANGGLAF